MSILNISNNKYNIIIILLVLIVLLFILSNYTEIKSKIINILTRTEDLGNKSAKIIDKVYDNFIAEGTPDNPSIRDKILIKMYELNNTINKADKLLDEIEARKLIAKADNTINKADTLLEQVISENLIKEVETLINEVKIILYNLKGTDSITSRQIFGPIEDRKENEKKVLELAGINKLKNDKIFNTELEIRKRMMLQDINKYNNQIQLNKIENNRNKLEKAKHWLNSISNEDTNNNDINIITNNILESEKKVDELKKAIDDLKMLRENSRFKDLRLDETQKLINDIKKVI